jgi:drug/metabolite transporter (DMT)-like permease
VVTVPLAILWLGERVSPREWIGIGLSVAAVVALSRETPAAKNPSTLQPLDASTRH